jgi:hypothetical protein
MKSIKKSILIVTVVSVFLIAPVPAFADTSVLADKTVAEVTDVVYLNDGSRIVTEISVEPSRVLTLATASATSTKTGSKTVSYENSSGTLLWYVKVTGTFSYDGSTSSCTSSTVTASAPDSNWVIAGQSASKSGSQATGTATAKLYKGSTVVQTVSKTVILSCSKTGALS